MDMGLGYCSLVSDNCGKLFTVLDQKCELVCVWMFVKYENI